MNKRSFLIPAIVLLFSCNNSGKDQAQSQSDMSHDSMMASTEAPHSSVMMKPMDEMMKEMHQMEPSGNVDLDFAMHMKSHHEGAVGMAKKELDSGSDKKLKAMAQKIIGEQKAEINKLEDFVESGRGAAKNYDPENKNEGFARVLDKNMMMLMDMPKVEGKSVDEQFVRLMIPHHQTAVYMAEGYLQYGKNGQLKSMAQKMVNDQTREIDELKKLEAQLR